MALTSKLIKSRLRHEGKRCPSPGPRKDNAFNQAADRIEELEKALNNLICDCRCFGDGKISPIIIEKSTDILKR